VGLNERTAMSKFQARPTALLRLGSARRLTRSVMGLMYREPHNILLTYDLP